MGILYVFVNERFKGGYLALTDSGGRKALPYIWTERGGEPAVGGRKALPYIRTEPEWRTSRGRAEGPLRTSPALGLK